MSTAPGPGPGHEVAGAVGVGGEQREERPPRQVLAERLHPSLVGALDRARCRPARPARSCWWSPVRVQQHRADQDRGADRPGPRGRSGRPRRRCAAGRCRWSSPARSPGPAAGWRPAATSAASCSVTRTWLSSTARRWALKSSPSRGTLPCTAAMVTVRSRRPRPRPAGPARPAARRPAPAPAARAGSDERAQRSAPGSNPAAEPARRTSSPRAQPGQHGAERQQRLAADRGERQQRPVGLAEADPAPGQPAERHPPAQRLAGHPHRRRQQPAPPAAGRPAPSRPRPARRTAPPTRTAPPRAAGRRSAGPDQQRQQEPEAEQEAPAETGTRSAPVQHRASSANAGSASHQRVRGGKLRYSSTPPPADAAHARRTRPSAVGRVRRRGAGDGPAARGRRDSAAGDGHRHATLLARHAAPSPRRVCGALEIHPARRGAADRTARVLHPLGAAAGQRGRGGRRRWALPSASSTPGRAAPAGAAVRRNHS